MESLAPKKLALLRIEQILRRYSNPEHPLTQEEIAARLRNEYGIVLERKAVSRNLSLLQEAGVPIGSGQGGSYLESKEFEDAELRLLIDGVLCSRHVSAKHSADLIDRLCGLSDVYFHCPAKNVHGVNSWSKTDNKTLFYSIELIDEAIEQRLQVCYDFNKYGVDKKLHKTSRQQVTPYLLLLHNQRYYLMAYSQYWSSMAFHRLDRITNITLCREPAVALRSIPGYEQGIDYKRLSTALPYMYTDEPERIVFLAEPDVVDQIIDWFGTDIELKEAGDKVEVSLFASPKGMKHWFMQYANAVEVLRPLSLRQRVKDSLQEALNRY